MGGASCPQSDQSPAAVAQGIAGPQLLGYTYQASTLDPNASVVDSRCPGKLTPSGPVLLRCPTQTLPAHSKGIVCFFLPVDGPCIASHLQTGTRALQACQTFLLTFCWRHRDWSVFHATTHCKTKKHPNIWFAGCETEILLVFETNHGGHSVWMMVLWLVLRD